jgi:ATPase subunit of ABC transporter with duplicated ATPase domains
MVYGNKLLFNEVDLILNTNTRYALVGANGAGKTTLMRLVAGEETPSDGSIQIPKDATMGWLKQDQFRYEDTRIVDVVIGGKPLLWEAMVEKEKLLQGDDWDEKNINRLGELEETIAHYDGYSAEALAEKLLTGLGVEAKYHHQPLKVLSGGFKIRVLLAQTLFQQPDILLLDEPTNHLDILSIDWLEKYLRNEVSSLIVFISHDREFIDKLADHIIDIDYGEVRQYSGRYDKFLAEKQLIVEQKLQEKKSVEEKIAHLQSFVDRFKAKASKARQAQSRAKMIEKLELPDIKKSSRMAPAFDFKPLRPSGRQVLKAVDLSKHFGERVLFQKVKFEINRGEKIAILGVNGVGKSTLVKVLLGLTPSDTGSYEWGHETHINYFSQDHHEELREHMTVLEWLTQQIPDKPELAIRKTLGQMLFRQDDVKKDILSISGGEAARLLLGRMMLQQGNILVLDEPTNHLDLESTDALAASLHRFPGTVLLVSHNRHFVQQIATRIFYLTKEGFQDFHGTYAEFMAHISQP